MHLMASINSHRYALFVTLALSFPLRVNFQMLALLGKHEYFIIIIIIIQKKKKGGKTIEDQSQYKSKTSPKNAQKY